MPIDIALVSYLLSSVASTAKIIEFALSLKGEATSKREVEQVVKNAESHASATSKTLSPEMLKMGTAMSGPIQEAFVKKILEIRELIVRIVSDSTLDPVQRRTMLNNNQRAFCEELNQLKKWNGGTLPPDLQQEWDLANCDQYTFY